MAEKEREWVRAPLHGQYGSLPLALFRPEASLVEKVRAAAVVGETGLHGPVPLVDVPLVAATADSLRDFADVHPETSVKRLPTRVRQWPGRGRRSVVGGAGAGTTEGPFSARWDDDDRCHVRTESVDGDYCIGWRHAQDIFVQDANYHPDGCQAFQSLDGQPFLLLLAKQRDDATVSPLHFVAFRCSGTQTLSLHPGVWHQAAFPLSRAARLYTKQGKVHGVVCVDFLHEFGVRVRIRDAFRSSPAASLPRALISLPSMDHPAPKDPSPAQRPPPRLILVDMATEKSVADFGRLLRVVPKEEEVAVAAWPAGERPMVFGDEGGLATEAFSMEWEEEIGSSYRQLLRCAQGRWASVAVGHTNYGKAQDPEDHFALGLLCSRIDGPSVVFPREREPYAVVVAKCLGESEEPDLSSARGLEVPEGTGLELRRAVWHSSPIPLRQCRQLPFLSLHSAVDARKEFLFSEEGLVPLRLRLRRLPPSPDSRQRSASHAF